MTVSNPTNLVSLIGNGLTTDFPFSFLIPAGTAVITTTEIATSVESEAISPSLYSVSGEDNPAGGSVTYPLTGSPLSSAYRLNIKRILPIAQALDLTDQSSYLPTLLENQLDNIVMMLSQHEELLSRAITVGPGGGSTNLVSTLVDAVSTIAANVAAAQLAEDNAETAASAAVVAQAAAEAAAAGLTTMPVQMNAAASTTFVDADVIAARKAADGSLIKDTWANIKALFVLVTQIVTTAQYRSNTSGKVLTTDQVWAAGAEVTLTDAATIAVDFSTFINGVVTLAGNRALGNPTNLKVGQTGVIRIVQDGTGSRTLSYSSDWEFANGTAPTLSTAAGSNDLLFYQIMATGRIFASLIKGVV